MKPGEKRKQSKPVVLSTFFNHPVTTKLVSDLLTVEDSSLITFFQQAYAAIEALGGEVTKSAVGLGDPERLLREAGELSPDVVKALGRKIEAMAERIKDG